MKKSDFVFEEDFAIAVVCDDCGERSEDEEFLDDLICPECGGILVTETSHEGESCAICDRGLDSWDDVYRNVNDFSLICSDCYEKL